MKKPNKELTDNSVNGTLSAECGVGVALGNVTIDQVAQGRHPATDPGRGGTQATPALEKVENMTGTTKKARPPDLPRPSETDPRNPNGHLNMDYTMEPYEPPNKTFRPNKNKKRPATNNLDLLTSKPRYNKYFIITGEEVANLATIDTIKANEDLNTHLKGTPTKITERRDCTLSVAVASEEQSHLITSLKKLGNTSQSGK